jgi:hypothetical protein
MSERNGQSVKKNQSLLRWTFAGSAPFTLYIFIRLILPWLLEGFRQ